MRLRISPPAVALGIVLFATQGPLTGCSDGSGSSSRVEAAVPSADATTAGRAPRAPEFSLASVAGGTIDLADYRGKVVLLDFWATWCGPCRAAIPHLNSLYADHRGAGLEIIGISVDQGRGAVSGVDLVKRFAKQIKMNYPLAMADADVVRAYGGIQSIPTAFLIDRDGRVREKYVGLRPKSAYEKDIRTLLAETASAEAEDETI